MVDARRLAVAQGRHLVREPEALDGELRVVGVQVEDRLPGPQHERRGGLRRVCGGEHLRDTRQGDLVVGRDRVLLARGSSGRTSAARRRPRPRCRRRSSPRSRGSRNSRTAAATRSRRTSARPSGERPRRVALSHGTEGSKRLADGTQCRYAERHESRLRHLPAQRRARGAARGGAGARGEGDRPVRRGGRRAGPLPDRGARARWSRPGSRRSSSPRSTAARAPTSWPAAS